MQFVFRQIHVLAMQPPDVFGQFLDIVAAQMDYFGFRKTLDVQPAEFHLIEIQADFLQTIKFHDPPGNMTDVVAFQIEVFQMLAATDAGWNAG